MSGILGVVTFDGRPIHQADIDQSLATISHRGPDRCNVWSADNVTFAQLMLCATPESLNETLPWEDRLSGLVITADARIDNRDELISQLCLETTTLPPIPDSQIIVAAFRKWGSACVDHLLGDFSFAIWDKKNQQLFVARDPMGLRPFYYYSCAEFFVFASAALAVAHAPRVPTRANEGRIADFLVNKLEGINNTETYFKNIYRLPPAHLGVVEKNTVSFQHYWQPDPERCLRLSSDDDYADALEEVLTLSIKARMRSQHPASSMLSGGADSSTVVGIASTLQVEDSGVPFRIYAAVSDNQDNCIESRFIRMMIDQGKLDPVYVSPSTANNYSSTLLQTSALMEDPFDDSWTMLRLIYLTAREHGSVAVMDGVDGDLITGITTGYPSYLLRQGEIKQGLHEINAQRIIDYEGKKSRLTAYADAIRPAITPNWLRRLKASSRLSDERKQCLSDAMLSKSFINRVNVDERWDEYKRQSTLGYCPSLRHAHAERIVVPYLTAAIERYNRIASYCGIEARQPFHDKRVIEHCLSLPWQQKAHNGWMKYGLRNVLQRVAPVEVAWRTEFDSIMWKFGTAWNELNRQKNIAVISNQRERLAGVIEQKQLDQMLSRYERGETEAQQPIWNVATLLNWLDRHQLEI